MFHIGQKLRVVAGMEVPAHYIDKINCGNSSDHRGEIVVVEGSGPACWAHHAKAMMAELGFPDGTFCYHIKMSYGGIHHAKPEWLVPYDDGVEAIEWTEELKKLCGLDVHMKETSHARTH